MVLFGLLDGSVADAMDRRRLVLLTTTGQLAAARLLAAQALAGSRSWGFLLLLVSLGTICSAAGAPARKSVAARSLNEQRFPAGVALNHLGFQAAVLTGPAVAGLAIAALAVTNRPLRRFDVSARSPTPTPKPPQTT